LDKEERIKKRVVRNHYLKMCVTYITFDLYFILIKKPELKHLFYSFCYIHTKIKNFLCIRTADVGSDRLFDIFTDIFNYVGNIFFC